MTFSTDPTTDIGKIRLIIGDKDGQYPIFQDDEIQAFLDMAGDVRRAAADALDAIASDQVMVLKVVRTLDLQTDGAAMSRELRQHAKSLREQANAADAGNGDLFDIAEFADDAFSQRERVWKQALRSL